MDNKKEQEEREWAFLREFRSAYSEFPEGEIRKSESPDFLVGPYARSGKLTP